MSALPPIPATATAARTVPDRGVAGRPADPVQRVAQEFEAMMVGQMLDSMFAGISTGGAFGGGQAEKTWRGFMLQEYGKAIAAAGSLGIGRMVQADVARLYGQQAEGTVR
nr:rod-binding protein [Azospirillum thermophilum]